MRKKLIWHVEINSFLLYILFILYGCACDAVEHGVQYMLLCAAVLGNMGPINRGSQEGCPSTKIYDSGADSCSNPSYYLIRISHLFGISCKFQACPKGSR